MCLRDFVFKTFYCHKGLLLLSTKKTMKLPLLILFLSFVTIINAREKLTVTHGPFIQFLGETGVTITWTTNKNAVAWVEVIPDDSIQQDLKDLRKYYSAEYGFKDLSKTHVIRLSDLMPGTKYTYCLYSQSVSDHTESSIQFETIAVTHIDKDRPFKFSTPKLSEEKEISFLVVNDIHEHNNLLENLLKKGDYPTADFVLFNGDMVNNMKNEDQYFDSFMNTAVQLFASEKPVYYARGNHETRGPFASAFPTYFKSPEGKLYYLFRRGPVCFIILDSGENLPDFDLIYRGTRAFDQYRDAECIWLKEALQSKEFMDAPFKVVVLHVPPFSGWHGANEIATKFVPLLNDAKIDVMLCGHLHKYVYHQPTDGINFPVIVNSNNTILRADADSLSINFKILNQKGEQVDLIQLKK